MPCKIPLNSHENIRRPGERDLTGHKGKTLVGERQCEVRRQSECEAPGGQGPHGVVTKRSFPEYIHSSFEQKGHVAPMGDGEFENFKGQIGSQRGIGLRLEDFASNTQTRAETEFV